MCIEQCSTMTRLILLAFLVTLPVPALSYEIDLLPKVCVDLVQKKQVPCNEPISVPGPIGIAGIAVAWKTSRNIRKRLKEANK